MVRAPSPSHKPTPQSDKYQSHEHHVTTLIIRNNLYQHFIVTHQTPALMKPCKTSSTCTGHEAPATQAPVHTSKNHTTTNQTNTGQISTSNDQTSTNHTKKHVAATPPLPSTSQPTASRVFPSTDEMRSPWKLLVGIRSEPKHVPAAFRLWPICCEMSASVQFEMSTS